MRYVVGGGRGPNCLLSSEVRQVKVVSVPLSKLCCFTLSVSQSQSKIKEREAAHKS